jgi:DNA-binding CsgD family transcriptional regulator
VGRAELTLRERQVLAAIRGGAYTYAALGRSMDPEISPRTVQDLVYSIAAKIPDPGAPKLVRVILYAHEATP